MSSSNKQDRYKKHSQFERRNRTAQSRDQGSVLWTLFLIGIILCLIDAVYLIRLLGRSKTESATEHREQVFVRGNARQRSGPASDNPKMQALSDSQRQELINRKQRLVGILREAGLRLDDTTLVALPDWKDITDLYGDRPIILGLDDQCQAFQSHSDPADHFASTAGTFNSGTNLMAELLIHNCHMLPRMKKYGERNRGIRWQVPWGKHIPIDVDDAYREEHKTKRDKDMDANNVLPAVTIRDPLFWMKSMCKHTYAARWRHNSNHCPNLLPNTHDFGLFERLRWNGVHEGQAIPVYVNYPDFRRQHVSLAHMWNDWYNAYLNATSIYRIMVRYEDLLFFPKETTEAVCKCAGGTMNSGRFKYIVETAKKGVGAHGDLSSRTGMVEAFIKYGQASNRFDGITKQDLEFATENFDSNLMKTFGYSLSLQPEDR